MPKDNDLAQVIILKKYSYYLLPTGRNGSFETFPNESYQQSIRTQLVSLHVQNISVQPFSDFSRDGRLGSSLQPG